MINSNSENCPEIGNLGDKQPAFLYSSLSKLPIKGKNQ